MAVEGGGWRAIGRVAELQHGAVRREQLNAAGISRAAVRHRVETGGLVRLLPGVFSIGHRPLAPLADEAAALLSVGDGCVLSHASAAALWGLAARPGDVQVTLIGRRVRPRPNVHTHRVPRLDPRDVRLRSGLPVTAPARTLIDLAAVAPDALERALAEARVARLVTDRELERALDRAPGRPGAAEVRRVIARDGRGLTRSEAERRLLRLIEDAALPRPLSNVRARGHEVDFLWPGERLVIEVDGHRFHAHRAAFERDRARDQALVAGGYRVIRVTWRQLVEQPLALAARIALALAA